RAVRPPRRGEFPRGTGPRATVRAPAHRPRCTRPPPPPRMPSCCCGTSPKPTSRPCSHASGWSCGGSPTARRSRAATGASRRRGSSATWSTPAATRPCTRCCTGPATCSCCRPSGARPCTPTPPTRWPRRTRCACCRCCSATRCPAWAATACSPTWTPGATPSAWAARAPTSSATPTRPGPGCRRAGWWTRGTACCCRAASTPPPPAGDRPHLRSPHARPSLRATPILREQIVNHRHLILVLAIGAGLALSACKRESTPAETAAPGTQQAAPQDETADEFIARVNAELKAMYPELTAAQWLSSTYIIDDSQLLAAKANEKFLTSLNAWIEQARRFEGQEMSPETARAINLLKLGTAMPAPRDPQKLAELTRIATRMEGMYGSGT